MNRKALSITFLIGILLCGLGCGICFAQYSSFEYAGVKDIGAEELIIESAEEKIGERGTMHIYGCAPCRNRSIIPDDTVPLDKIIIDVTYNPEKVEMCVGRIQRADLYGLDQSSEEYYDEDIYIGNYIGTSEVADLFEIKDEFLADFKKNRISAYDIVSIKSMEIRVNPANAERISLS